MKQKMAIDGSFWIHFFESEQFGDNTLLFKEGEAYLKAVVRESLRLQVEKLWPLNPGNTFTKKFARPQSKSWRKKILKFYSPSKRWKKFQISAAGPWQHQTAVCASPAWKVLHFMELLFICTFLKKTTPPSQLLSIPKAAKILFRFHLDAGTNYILAHRHMSRRWPCFKKNPRLSNLMYIHCTCPTQKE